MSQESKSGQESSSPQMDIAAELARADQLDAAARKLQHSMFLDKRLDGLSYELEAKRVRKGAEGYLQEHPEAAAELETHRQQQQQAYDQRKSQAPMPNVTDHGTSVDQTPRNDAGQPQPSLGITNDAGQEVKPSPITHENGAPIVPSGITDDMGRPAQAPYWPSTLQNQPVGTEAANQRLERLFDPLGLRGNGGPGNNGNGGLGGGGLPGGGLPPLPFGQ